VLFELSLERVARSPALRAGIAGLAVIAMLATPMPVSEGRWRRGVTDEWDYYRVENRYEARYKGEALARWFRDLPVRVAFVGGQAIIAYFSDVPVAIEAETGLTDSAIARQPLAQRGRPGHEKHASWRYLIETRRTHFMLQASHVLADTLEEYIPVVPVAFDHIKATALTWDPAVMDSLRARGAVIPDFRARLDQYLAAMSALPESTARSEAVKLRRFYFDVAGDARRDSMFRARLGAHP
jgi:hypothetical protein